MLVNVFRQYEPKEAGDQPVFPRSWPKNGWKETKAVAEVMELEEALTRGFRYPAYLTAYAPTKGNRRLSKDILSSQNPLAYVGGAIDMILFLADVDGPSHGGKKASDGPEAVTVEAWWEQELPKIEKLLEDHPGLFVYRSRGGYRIVGRIDPIIHISGPVGGEKWTQRYVAWLNYLVRRYGIKTYGKDSADKLGDWTRLQRVPHDSRDFATPDQLEVIGDPANVGVWAPKLAPEDIPAERAPRKAPATEVGSGTMLLALVQLRGLRCEASGASEYDICCPRYAMHSPNEAGKRDYEGKTRLYTAQGKIGGIKCFSDGCTEAHPTPGDWLDEFSWEEKLRARRSLGRSELGDPRPVTYDKLVVLGVSPNALSILLEGKDDSRPDKTPPQCIHHVVCDMLRAGCLPEYILGALTDSKAFALAEYVLAQTDPGWYFEECLSKAKGAMAEVAPAEAASETAASTPDPMTDELVHNTTSYFRYYFSFGRRAVDAPFGDSDQSLASMAVACFGKRLVRRIEGQGDWLTWNGHCWEQGESGRVRLMLGEMCACMKEDLRATRSGLRGAAAAQLIVAFEARHPHYMGEVPLQKRMQDELNMQALMVKKLESHSGMNAVVVLIGDALTVTVDDLDRNSDQVVFLNGAWNAKTDRWRAPHPNDLATKAIPIEWIQPPSEATERWGMYLQSLGFDDEALSFLQRFFGYALLGRGTEKRFCWFRGETDVSKSTLMELVTQCVGTYLEPTSSDLWLQKGGSRPGHTDDLAALRGARFVTADEFPKISRFDDALMKKCTSGGGKMRASAKGKSGFAFVPRFALFFASNFDPQIAEDDAALLNRLTTFTFKNKIVDKNPRFVADFLSLPGQKLAILDWVMTGARAYITQGLGGEPTQVKESRAEFLEGQISVGDQLSELLKKEDGGAVSMTAILERLSELQQRTRQRAPFTTSQVAVAIRKLFGASIVSKSGVRVFHGVALRDTKLRVANDEKHPWEDPDPDYTPQQFEAPGF